MAKTLENTGERMIPELHKGQNKYGAHFGRYQAGLPLVKGKVVLDIACGTGYGSKLMASNAKKVYGVDVSIDSIEYAKKNYSAKNIEFIVGDGIAIPLKESSIDIAVSYESIEHIADYRKFMSEIKRVLRPGGILLLSTPNELESGGGNHFHLHEFTYTELKRLVNKYFKHRKDFFQTLWLYNSILPGKMQSGEWQDLIQTTSTVKVRPEQSIFFFMICSDTPIKDEIKPQGVISQHFRQHESPEQLITQT